MARQSTLRRMSMSSPYIGSGNRTDTFNRKPEVPFKKLKAIYGDQLENFIDLELEPGVKTILLTEEEREHIKSKVRSIVERERLTSIVSFIASVVVLVILISLVFYFFN